ncbi:cytochrome c-type biogenesis protein CcmH [Microaerobacter geothermalis]|uniref:cytochrome c-type biogenesis protein n=1 Tax=Microaerobacter geothermalis TaxID=674972 RepID=UPI001F333DB2|nr:cytochrome c-type biogenesis protein CcmH [Microaerobacter geothermalis]MCF6092543.1 cytochrome c-type biogenesis protein CcmH [Microaerobacter geothermalis]
MKKLLGFILLFTLFGGSQVLADHDPVITRDDVLRVAKELHPPGCTNSMTADYCMLATAGPLRQEIYELLKQGYHDKEIINKMVDKYGERILASPARRGFQWTAWVMPGVVISGASVGFVILLRRWRRPSIKGERAPGREMDPRIKEKIDKDLKDYL